MNRFVPNRNVAAQLRRDPRFKAGLREHAERAKEEAERIAREHEETGHYGKNFIVTEGPTDVRLGNLDIAAHLIEWGSANNSPFAPLRRAVRAVGLRLAER